MKGHATNSFAFPLLAGLIGWAVVIPVWYGIAYLGWSGPIGLSSALLVVVPIILQGSVLHRRYSRRVWGPLLLVNLASTFCIWTSWVYIGASTSGEASRQIGLYLSILVALASIALVPLISKGEPRMLGRIRRSKRLQFLLGLTGWLLFWTAFYAIAEAGNPSPNLGDSIMLGLIAIAIHPVAILLLLLTKLRWAALGYAAAMVLNVAGQFIAYNVVLDAEQVVVDGITYYTRYIRDFGSLLRYLWWSIPFFLPVGFGF
jgi:hypothetical protein